MTAPQNHSHLVLLVWRPRGPSDLPASGESASREMGRKRCNDHSQREDEGGTKVIWTQWIVAESRNQVVIVPIHPNSEKT
jgi:hypothetical protein